MQKIMKSYFFIIFFLLFRMVSYSETTVFMVFGPQPKGMAAADAEILNSAVMGNLQDLNDLLNNIYLDSDTIEQIVKYKINEINATNTNIIIINKKPVSPKKIQPIILKPFNPAVLKALNSYFQFDSILLVNYSINPVKGSPANILITYTLQNSQGVKTASASASVRQSRLIDPDYVNTTIKESIINLYSLWSRYYYATKKYGSVMLNILQKNPEINIKSMNLKLINGKNDNIPFGNYLVDITASNCRTLLTNITIGDKAGVYKISLVSNKTMALTGSGLGNLLIDSDFPNAKFIVVEDDISGLTPMTLTNIKTGEKTVIFDETPEYGFNKFKTIVKENDTAYEYIKLKKKGSGFRTECNVEGTTVIVDKEIAGVVSNGIFDGNSSPGLHSLTLLKDRYVAYKTNINLRADTNELMSISLVPKKISGYIATPQANGIGVVCNDQIQGKTPLYFYYRETNDINLTLTATNEGFNNVVLNIPWKWSTGNNYIAMLKPLFGGLKIDTVPDNVSVVIESVYRGKTSTNGLGLKDLPSRRLKLRLEKEGYKTINTNIFIAPDIENSFSTTLKEAPAKAFITSSPEKGLDIYINGEYSGTSGEGVVSIETGKLSIKLKKRGFKTIVTNIDAGGKEPLILNFTTVAGIGEDEFVENISEDYNRTLKLLDKYSFNNAGSNFISIRSNAEASDYKDLPQVRDLIEKIDLKMKWLPAVSNISNLIDAGDESFTREDFETSQRNYDEAIKLMDSSGAVENAFYSDKKKDLLLRIEDMNKRKADKEAVDQVRQFIVKINPILYEGDKYADKYQFTAAIEKYKDALKLIDDSPLKDNQKLKENRDRIEKRLKRAQQQSKERDAWWPRMSRYWDGLSFDFMGTMIASPVMSFDPGQLNIPVFVRLGIHPVPVFGITIGGMYNLSYSGSDLLNKYAQYAVTAGAILRVPVFPQLAAFGEYQLTLSDFQNFNLFQYGIVNLGIDAKYGWIGLKLFYQLAFASGFKTMFNGLGIGISFWITEE